MQPGCRRCRGTCCGGMGRAVCRCGCVTLQWRCCPRAPRLLPRRWFGGSADGAVGWFWPVCAAHAVTSRAGQRGDSSVRSICRPCPVTRSPRAPRYLALEVTTGARCCEEPAALIRPLITKRWVFCSTRNASLPPAL